MNGDKEGVDVGQKREVGKRNRREGGRKTVVDTKNKLKNEE